MERVDLDAAADQLRAKRPDLPHGIKITIDRETRNLLVANDKLGFCVTEQSIRDGLHLTQFEHTVDRLIDILDHPEKYSLERR